ncbi:hypothetical protein BC831DRAFT_466018 [Entophlyctis helioformis]|nr:hypothetical protein BC831DRAFT_466018 [Entophlyctis helioformis]
MLRSHEDVVAFLVQSSQVAQRPVAERQPSLLSGSVFSHNRLHSHTHDITQLSPLPPPAALLTAALAFKRLGCLREAEFFLIKHLDMVPFGAEAVGALVDVYECQGKTAMAIKICESMVSNSKTDKVAYLSRAIRLHIVHLVSTNDHSDIQAIVTKMQDLRYALKKEKCPPEFWPIAERLLSLLCDPQRHAALQASCKDQLVDHIAFVASIEGVSAPISVHIQLVQYFTMSRQTASAVASVETGFRTMRESIDWLRAAVTALDRAVEPACTLTAGHTITRSLSRLSLQLEVHFRLAWRLLQTRKDGDTIHEAIHSYAQAIEESDAILPALATLDTQQLWIQTRMEHYTRLQFLKGSLMICQDGMASALRLLAISLSGPVWLPDTPLFFPRRLVDAVYSIVSLAAHDASPRQSSVQPTMAIQLGLPTIRLDERLVQLSRNTAYIAPNTQLSWLLNDFDRLTETAIQSHPWDLGQFLVYASWQLYDGRLRGWLRKLFPLMPERSSLQSPNKLEQPRFTKTFASVADMEAFIILLLVARQMLACRLANETASTLSAMQASVQAVYQPPAIATAFWHRMLDEYGQKKPEARCYASAMLGDSATFDVVAELRGNTGLSDVFLRLVYGSIGVCFAEMETRSGLDRASDAQFYLGLFENWDVHKQPKTRMEARLVNACFPTREGGSKGFTIHELETSLGVTLESVAEFAKAKRQSWEQAKQPQASPLRQIKHISCPPSPAARRLSVEYTWDQDDKPSSPRPPLVSHLVEHHDANVAHLSYQESPASGQLDGPVHAVAASPATLNNAVVVENLPAAPTNRFKRHLELLATM